MMESNCANDNTVVSGEILNELIEENNFLLELVDTIPAKLYFDHDIQEKIAQVKHSTMDSICEGLKVNASSMKKHKRARLDPLFQKSVSEINREINDALPKISKKKGLLLPSASITRADNIEELQKRLQLKIDEFHLKRQGLPGKDPRKKKLKNMEKKMKQKQALIKAAKEAKLQNKTPLPLKKDKPKPKPEFNKEKKIIFGKLDFGEDDVSEKKHGRGSKKDLLKKAEKKTQKIAELKSTNPEKAATIEEKEKWNNAILKSANVKVKDDPVLLKKSLKRDEKIKQKKAKAWKERVEHTEEKMQKRQDRRNKNIQKRKTDKLNNKLKQAKKKGRVIPKS